MSNVIMTIKIVLFDLIGLTFFHPRLNLDPRNKYQCICPPNLPSACMSDVQSVRLSRRSCMIRVESL